MRALLTFTLIAILLAACTGPTPAAPTPAPPQVQLVEVTRIVQKTVVVVVTATPPPPTPSSEAALATSESCPPDQARLYDGKIHESLLTFAASGNLFTLKSETAKQVSYSLMLDKRQEFTELVPPECGQAAHQAILKFMDDSVSLADSILQRRSDRDEKRAAWQESLIAALAEVETFRQTAQLAAP